MNEGHSALLTLSLLDEACGSRGLESAGEDEYAIVRARSAFTTHTPVAAGHDRFGFDLVRSVLDPQVFAAIERLPFIHDGVLNMTELGLFFSRYVNGVARRHGEVASAMHPGFDVHSITNGIHSATWASPAHRRACSTARSRAGVKTTTTCARRTCCTSTTSWTRTASPSRSCSPKSRSAPAIKLDPSVLTIGFARRAATYKRADLVFNDLEQLREISARCRAAAVHLRRQGAPGGRAR